MNSNTKRIYLAVLTIVTVAAIIFGTMYHILHFFKHADDFFFGHPGNSESGEESVSDFNGEYDNVTSIDVDCAMSKVTIEEGDKFAVEYDGDKSLEPTVTLKSNGTLEIRQEGNRTNSLKNMDNELTITIAEDIKLDYLALDMAMGDVKIDDISAGKITIDAAMGNVNCDDVTADDLYLDANMGNIEVDDVEFKNVTADADMGNITIGCDHVDAYDIEASADLGKVSINGEKVTGSYSAKARSERIGTIKASCDMGNIEIN